MDDALTDLDDRPGQVPGPDDAVAVALRRALDGNPRPGSSALLAGVQARATRSHRRRLGLAGAAVAGAVVAVTAVALGPGPVDGPTQPGPVAAAPTASPATAPTASPATAPAAGPAVVDPDAPLLRPEDVTAFSAGIPLTREVDPAGTSTGPVVGGACVDGVLPVAVPSATWGASFRLTSGDQTRPTLLEAVWRWDDPSSARAALDAVRAQLPGCSGPGPDGRGPTEAQDAGALAPAGGDALALTASSTGGSGPDQEVQVLLQQGGTLVRLQTALPGTDGAAAVRTVAQTAWTAATRALETASAAERTAQLQAEAAQQAAQRAAQASPAAASPRGTVAPRTPSMVTHGPDPRE